MTKLETIGYSEFDARMQHGMQQYARPIAESIACGDMRLGSIRFDPSPAAYRLWGFLRSEEDRLTGDRRSGKKLVGAMKDLGTVPVLAYSLPNLTAFYPDGAWWLPCMNVNSRALTAASALGINESFCPVRAMIGAFETQGNFPVPDKLICSVGATCDDFSALAQFLNDMGHEITWWEIPHRRQPGLHEKRVLLPGGFVAAGGQVDFVSEELRRIGRELEKLAGFALTDEMLWCGITKANAVRTMLERLRETVFLAETQPIASVEMLIAEMLAIHFCSNMDETAAVLFDLLMTAERRVEAKAGFSAPDAARIFWVNLPADFGVMNILEKLNCRLCGTDFMFQHALAQIPDAADPYTALAMSALADPMVGPASDRAEWIAREAVRFGAEAVVVSRIPGASHCAYEGKIIARTLERQLDIPVLEIEVQSAGNSIEKLLIGRLEALVETVRRTGIAIGHGRAFEC